MSSSLILIRAQARFLFIFIANVFKFYKDAMPSFLGGRKSSDAATSVANSPSSSSGSVAGDISSSAAAPQQKSALKQ